MKDVREDLEELNELAESQREQKARINGKLEILEKSLKDMGLSFTKATEEVKRLKASVAKDNTILEKMIKEFKHEYSEKL